MMDVFSQGGEIAHSDDCHDFYQHIRIQWTKGATSRPVTEI